VEMLGEAMMSGIIMGSLFGAMAVGLTIIYGVIKMFNFAHGIIAILGAYLAWWLFSSVHLNLIGSIALSFFLMFLIGILIFISIIRVLLRTPRWPYSTIIASIGLGIFLENLLLQIFGPRIKSMPAFFESNIKVGGIMIGWHEISLILIVLSLMLILRIFFKKTTLGNAMRAVAQSPEGAKIVGINTLKIFGYAYMMGIAITGLSGVFLSTKTYIVPHQGWDWMVKGFIIVAFGGLGNVMGAYYAALILGILEALVITYFGAIWVWNFWFFSFLIILLIRPEGLLGGRMA